MQQITSITGLKNAIRLLEVEQAFKEQQLREQFSSTCERLKPVNLLRSKLNNIVSSPYLIDNILNMALSLTTGYLTKKIVVGASGNIVRRLFGSVLQFGVTSIVAKHPGAIKSFGRFIFQHLPTKKELNTKKP